MRNNFWHTYYKIKQVGIKVIARKSKIRILKLRDVQSATKTSQEDGKINGVIVSNSKA